MCLVSGMGVARIFSKGGRGKVGGGGGHAQGTYQIGMSIFTPCFTKSDIFSG